MQQLRGKKKKKPQENFHNLENSVSSIPMDSNLFIVIQKQCIGKQIVLLTVQKLQFLSRSCICF